LSYLPLAIKIITNLQVHVLQFYAHNVCIVYNIKEVDWKMFNFWKARRISIVCFQETHSTKDVAVKWEDEWGSKCSFSQGDSKSAGVSVMFRNGFDFKVNDSILDQNGCLYYIPVTTK
jgi:exonuclease III